MQVGSNEDRASWDTVIQSGELNRRYGVDCNEVVTEEICGVE